jgi:hypothetical protein
LELPETKQVEVPRVLILLELSQFLADSGLLPRLDINAFDHIGLIWTRLGRVEGRHLENTEGCLELKIAGEKLQLSMVGYQAQQGDSIPLIGFLPLSNMKNISSGVPQSSGVPLFS